MHSHPHRHTVPLSLMARCRKHPSVWDWRRRPTPPSAISTSAKIPAPPKHKPTSRWPSNPHSLQPSKLQRHSCTAPAPAQAAVLATCSLADYRAAVANLRRIHRPPGHLLPRRPAYQANSGDMSPCMHAIGFRRLGGI